MFLLELADQPQTITADADDIDDEDIPIVSSASDAMRLLNK